MAVIFIILSPHHTFKMPQFMLVLSTNKAMAISWNTSEETGCRHRKLLAETVLV